MPENTEEEIKKETPYFEPAGCRPPLEDYSRIWIRGYVINRRTYDMLQYAAELYGGEIDITDLAITQGSFSDNGSASFGTHLGGGAIDLSVRSIENYAVLNSEIEPLIRALRAAGFATWLRDNDEVYPGTGIHIHAIAIGDKQLSYPAREQLTGPFGYFRGYNGLPNSEGVPIRDHHGPPVVCNWMRELGYEDLRSLEEIENENLAILSEDWQEDLKYTAAKMLSPTPERTMQIAQNIDPYVNNPQRLSELRLPLAIEILIHSGLIPPYPTSACEARDFKPGLSINSNVFLNCFSPDVFSIYSTDGSGDDFESFPGVFLPGDLLVGYGNDFVIQNGFVISEIDEFGRAFTINFVRTADDRFLINRLLIDDVDGLQEGRISAYQTFSDSLLPAGVVVIRRKGVTSPAGSLYNYMIRPGDSLQSIAIYFHTTPDEILRRNQGKIYTSLKVGMELDILVNTYSAP